MAFDTANWTGRSLAGDRFQVKARMGGGFLGTVYHARDQRLSCDVVLRVPPAQWLQDSEFASRFFQVVHELTAFVHPHVAKVIDLAEHDGLPFAVVQHLSGGSLRSRQRTDAKGKPRPMPPDDLPGWLGKIAATLDELHRQKKFHRDIRPENILYNANGDVGLSDFCLSHALSGLPAKTQAALLEGVETHYCAPEAQRSCQGDGRADLYALAVTLYELLAGRHPFQGAKEKGLELQALHVMAAVPQQLSDAVHKALCRNPADRFADCSALAQAVLQGRAQAAQSPERDSFWDEAISGESAAESGSRQVTCSGCHQAYTLPEVEPGERIRCPLCGELYRPPQKVTQPVTNVDADQPEGPAAERIAAARPIPASKPVSEPRPPRRPEPSRGEEKEAAPAPIRPRPSRPAPPDSREPKRPQPEPEERTSKEPGLLGSMAQWKWPRQGSTPEPETAESEADEPPRQEEKKRPRSAGWSRPRHEPDADDDEAEPEETRLPEPQPDEPPRREGKNRPRSAGWSRPSYQPEPDDDEPEPEESELPGPQMDPEEMHSTGEKARSKPRPPRPIYDDEEDNDESPRPSASRKGTKPRRPTDEEEIENAKKGKAYSFRKETSQEEEEPAEAPTQKDRAMRKGPLPAPGARARPPAVDREPTGPSDVEDDEPDDVPARSKKTSKGILLVVAVVVLLAAGGMAALLFKSGTPKTGALVVNPGLGPPTSPGRPAGTSPGAPPVMGEAAPEKADAGRILAGHTGSIWAVSFSPDGQLGLSASTSPHGEPNKPSLANDTGIRVWDLEAGTMLKRLTGPFPSVTCLAVCPKSNQFLTAGEQAVVLWDGKTQQIIRAFEYKNEETIRSIALSADGTQSLCGGGDGGITLWETASGKLIRAFDDLHTNSVVGVALSPDGKWALSAGLDGTVRLWTVADGQQLHCFLAKKYGGRGGVVFSPNGQRALCAADNLIYLLDLESKKELSSFSGHEKDILSIALSRDGDQFLSGGEDKVIRLWNVADGKVLQRFEGHTGPVTCLAFSADGKRALSGSADKTVRLWRLAN